ncbi:TetR/AcrR family transcriptional regulator [Nocardia harenae]|uniref:TetR/AcrR family transcriptional regulator n=1 Tax=Nocardia harenae TaxID=358707 RepID=UPI0008317381|nr:TetR family transcriptional regulator [Nocardia harenae]
MTAGRSGRRPGSSGARAAILEAAKKRFSEHGFDRTSIRAVAGDAGVDPALVHHYFGSKRQLFAAVVELPIDPEVVMEVFGAVPLDQLGATMVRILVTLWDSELGSAAVAVLRTLVAGTDPGLARSFFVEVALERVRSRIATASDDGSGRVALVASQMLGVLVARKVVELEPLASMPVEAVVAAVGPTVQRYLTGELG